VEPRPDADAALDSPAADSVAKAFGKHHGRTHQLAPSPWPLLRI
jgi:hypothetical protein